MSSWVLKKILVVGAFSSFILPEVQELVPLPQGTLFVKSTHHDFCLACCLKAGDSALQTCG
jgi:hypothetical protein